MLAVMAALFLLAGLGIERFALIPNTSQEFLGGVLMKVGVVLGLAWVAAPQLERFGWQRLQGSMLAAALVVLVLWAVRPRIGALAAGILIAGSIVFGVVSRFRAGSKR